jgi:hypothetical protein
MLNRSFWAIPVLPQMALLPLSPRVATLISPLPISNEAQNAGPADPRSKLSALAAGGVAVKRRLRRAATADIVAKRPQVMYKWLFGFIVAHSAGLRCLMSSLFAPNIGQSSGCIGERALAFRLASLPSWATGVFRDGGCLAAGAEKRREISNRESNPPMNGCTTKVRTVSGCDLFSRRELRVAIGK